MGVKLCVLEQLLLVAVLFILIRLCIFLHTSQIMRFDNYFTRCTNFFITCCVFLYLIGFWNKINYIVSHFVESMVCLAPQLTDWKMRPHFADSIKYSLMYLLKLLNSCGFMRQCDDITVVKWSQHWPLC